MMTKQHGRKIIVTFAVLASIYSSLICSFFARSSNATKACEAGALARNASQTLPPLASETFTLAAESEVGLEIVARSPRGASWAREGAEAAALTVMVDDRYSSDLLLYASSGDEAFPYRVHLGRLAPGSHTVSVHLNASRSAREVRITANLQNERERAAGGVEIRALRVLPASPAPDAANRDALVHALALARSPVLYARANSIDRFTDVPLLMYYEVLNEESGSGGAGDLRVRYTIVFSHEDGGTPTRSLMARWGRATDIEWVYEFTWRGGRVVEESYQGVEHKTKSFTGERIHGDHPLLAIASDNNNFSDLACSAVRFALLPVRADLHASSRERVMDKAAWTYRVMAEELAREGRIGDSSSTDANIIADPREYLYVEAYAEQEGTSLCVEVQLDGYARPVSSDLADARLRVDRSGYFRIATRLPRDSVASARNEIRAVSLRCHSTMRPAESRAAQRVRISKIFMLDENYVPREIPVVEHAPAALRPGQTAAFRVRL